MNINFELYRNFYITANCSSITEAAQKLMISQPAVTKSIQNLEASLNGILFIRSKKGIALTEEGKKFYNYIRPAVEQIIDAESLFSSITKFDNGKIKIGTSYTILKYFLIDYLKIFSDMFPKVNISLEESYTPDLINLVKNGNIDVAIIYASENDSKLENLKVFNLKKLHYCLIGNKKYTKYSRTPISFTSIKKEDLVLNSINPIHESLFDKETKWKLDDYSAHVNLTSHSLVYEFVKQGFGIGVVIKEFIENSFKSNDLYEIKLKEKFQPLNLVLITNKTNFPSFATSQLIDVITNPSKKTN